MKNKLYQIFKGFAPSIIAAIIIAMTILSLIMPTIVREESMQPNFYDGDYLLVSKQAYNNENPKRGDVIIVKDVIDELLIKRVIGLPGETLEIKDGKVYVNNELLEEEYLKDNIKTTVENAKNKTFKLANDEYFVMGDNRPVSLDSRSDIIGPITKDNIAGRVFMRLFPFNKAEKY